VGANVGIFSLKAARHVGKHGKVLAIEASASIFGYLEKNVSSSGYSNIVCKLVAAAEQDGIELAFYNAQLNTAAAMLEALSLAEGKK